MFPLTNNMTDMDKIFNAGEKQGVEKGMKKAIDLYLKLSKNITDNDLREMGFDNAVDDSINHNLAVLDIFENYPIKTIIAKVAIWEQKHKQQENINTDIEREN